MTKQEQRDRAAKAAIITVRDMLIESVREVCQDDSIIDNIGLVPLSSIYRPLHEAVGIDLEDFHCLVLLACATGKVELVHNALRYVG